MSKPNRDHLLKINRDGHKVGRDPSTLTREELDAAGFVKTPMKRVVRDKCMHCCLWQRHEVRNCTSVDCPNWLYRLGFDPYAQPRGRSIHLNANSDRSEPDEREASSNRRAA